MAVYERRFGDGQTERAHTVDGSDDDARMRGLVAAGSNGWAVFTPDEPEQDEPSRPANNASTEAWADYARAQGATEEDVEGLSRKDLIELYGG